MEPVNQGNAQCATKIKLISAGEVYHWPAGHTGWTDEGTAFIEVGPVAPMRAFGDHAKKLFGG